MGADDANEGAEQDECPGHEWQPRHLAYTADGVVLHYECIRCETPSTMTRADLNGT